MVKRFHDTNIWDQDWFLEMPWEYKMFWLGLKDHCNHAGIWKPNKKNLEFKIGGHLDLTVAEQLFNKGKQRVRILKNGRWFIEDFITFQYGHYMNPKNRVHYSILNDLLSNEISLDSIRGQLEVNLTPTRPQRGVKQGVKDKDKDSVGSKDFNKVKTLTPIQSIVIAYKIKKGFEENDKAWDKLNFGRCTRSAKQLLDYFKDWRQAIICIDNLGTFYDSKRLDWRLETIVKNASEWKLKRQKQEQNNG